MIVPEQLLAWRFEDVTQSYTSRDTTIYALGVGLGADPLDEGQLPFVRVEGPPPVFPTMAVVLARAAAFSADPRSGIDRAMVVHGEQGLELLRPLPADGTVMSRSRISHLVDKGHGRGAVIYNETTLSDVADGQVLARCWSSIFARADGGFGGSPTPPRIPHSIPSRPPDAVCTMPTFSNAALIYRLNGDLNPLHSDPATALKAGFDRPILHGLCTYGVVAHAVLSQFCDYDPARLRRFDVRFSAPVFPGEAVEVRMWRDGEEISFQAYVPSRGVRVIDNGLAMITA